MTELNTPISKEDIKALKIGQQIVISGKIFCGRDAVLPLICDMFLSHKLEEKSIYLDGGVIFHSAVSIAGVGPTSSNKFEIESSISLLSAAGIRIHLGKGEISQETVRALGENGSAYAIIPPITAYLESHTIGKKILLHPELGMEAFYELEVCKFPALIASINGESIYE